MNMVISFLRSFLFLVCLVHACNAQQLQWASQELKFNPSPSEVAVVGKFKFTNIGTSEAKILKASSSCGCTTVAFDKKRFAPGESGELKATFKFGSRVGLQQKVILVESNDPKQPRTVLTMKVNIPEIAQVRPTFLYWASNQPIAPREVTVRVLNGFPVKNISISSSHPQLSAKVETIREGQEYRIIVTPGPTDQPITAILSIKTDYPPENPKTYFVNVRVQPGG